MDIDHLISKTTLSDWNPGRNNPYKNMYCIIEGVVVVKLNNEKHMIIDESNISILDSYTWYIQDEKTIRSSITYITVPRYILGISDKNIVVTHKNGNVFDNRRSNLHSVTRSRYISTTLRSNNKSGIVGVHFSSRKEAWFASIRLKNKRKCKWFYVSEYGSVDVARNEASNWRKQMIDEMEL